MESLDLEAPTQAKEGKISQLLRFLRLGAHTEPQAFQRLGQEDAPEHEEHSREGRFLSE